MIDKKSVAISNMVDMSSPKRSTVSSVMIPSEVANRFVQSNVVKHESDTDVYQMHQTRKKSYGHNSSIKAAGKISPHAKANRIVRIRQTPLKFENQGGGFYDPNLT